MKPKLLFLTLMLAIATLTGYLLSKVSLVGRTGINLFYKEYKVLKVWWQAGLLVFVIWTILFFLQGWTKQKVRASRFKWIQIGAILAALIGLYFTYQDFRNNLSHRWLGERFHLGGYLFWIGWISISIFHLINRKKDVLSTGTPGTNMLPSS